MPPTSSTAAAHHLLPVLDQDRLASSPRNDVVLRVAAAECLNSISAVEVVLSSFASQYAERHAQLV